MALVISRKLNEGLRIGPDVRVFVNRISGDKVRIGIDAPASMSVLRDELGVPEPTPVILCLDADQPLWLARLKSNHKLVYAIRNAETERHFFWLKEMNR